MLFNGAGGNIPITGVNLVFNDSAANTLSSNEIVSGTYRPGHNDFPEDSFTAPAPAGPYSTGFGFQQAPGISGTFIGATNPNGNYNLFIEDFVGGDFGAFTGGWEITISFTPVPEPSSILLGCSSLRLCRSDDSPAFECQTSLIAT